MSVAYQLLLDLAFMFNVLFVYSKLLLKALLFKIRVFQLELEPINLFNLEPSKLELTYFKNCVSWQQVCVFNTQHWWIKGRDSLSNPSGPFSSYSLYYEPPFSSFISTESGGDLNKFVEISTEIGEISV